MSLAALAGQRAQTLGGQITLEQLRREREARLIQAAGLGVQQLVQGGLQGAQVAAGVYERDRDRQAQQLEADRLAAHRNRLAALQEQRAAAAQQQSESALALEKSQYQQQLAQRRADAYRQRRLDANVIADRRAGRRLQARQAQLRELEANRAQGARVRGLELQEREAEAAAAHRAATTRATAEHRASLLDLEADKLELQKDRAKSADELGRLQAAADRLRAEATMITAKSGAATRAAGVEGAAADRERRGARDNLDDARGAARGLAPSVIEDPASLSAAAAGLATRYGLDPGKAEDLIREAAVGTGQKQQEIDIKQKRVDDLSADRRARGAGSASVLQREANSLRGELGRIEKAIGDIDKDILSHVEGAPGKAAKQARKQQLEQRRDEVAGRIREVEGQFGKAVEREQGPASGEVEKVGGTSLDRKGFDSLTEDERARVRKLVDARVASGEDKATAVREAMRQVLKDRPAEQEPPGILERARRKIGGIVEGAMVPGAAEPKYPPEVLEEYRQVAAEQGLEASKRRRELERLHPGIADAAR